MSVGKPSHTVDLSEPCHIRYSGDIKRINWYKWVEQMKLCIDPAKTWCCVECERQ